MTPSPSPGTHPYDDASTPAQMVADCRAAEVNLRLDARLEHAARRAVLPAPSIHFEDQPREVTKPTIEVSEAAARLAAAIYTD